MKICNACNKHWDSDSRFCPADGTPLTEAPVDPLNALIGKLLNRTYKIEAKLGQGGMGAVFRAKHVGIGDIVAIKVISPEHTQNSEVLKRFRREAQAVRRLAHPNAVAVHDFNLTEDGLLFMVMEYVKGITLEDYLKTHSFLTPKRVLEILRPIAAALDVAHSLGIIHRDLKPANLMLCQDTAGHEQIKVLDFGTARLSFPETDLSPTSNITITLRGQICGTPVYMSPEQIMDEPITAASDIYALGVVLYQLLTGTVPFMAKSAAEIFMNHLETPPEPPSKRRPELNPEFDAIILKALAKQPDQRYQSAEALTEDFATLIASFMREQFMTAKSAANKTSANTDSLAESGPPQPDFNQFVIRESELKRLKSEAANFIEGKARPIFIMGSPGIGKTELVSRFRDWALRKEITVITGKFFDCGSKASEPLQLFKNMLASLLPETDKESNLNVAAESTREKLRLHFGLNAAVSDDLSVDKWQVFEELNSAFFSIARTRSLMVMLDDLQWADTLSLEYLGYLLRNNNNEQKRLSFVGTARAEEAGSKGHPLREWLVEQISYFPYEKMDLGPFDPETIQQWLQAVFSYIDISQHDIDVLHQITDGNPFYLGEVVRLLIDSEKIVYEDGIWRGSGFDKVKVPHSIDSIVKFKLENCPEELRQLLAQAAVIGDDFNFELLNIVSGLDEVEMERLLIAGVKAFLLREETTGAPGDNYRFYQTTIRYVIYEEIPKRQRRRLHQQVAAALGDLYKGKTQKVNAAITYHYHAAGEWEKTFTSGVPAISQAWQQQVMGEVIRLAKMVEEALGNIESPGDDLTQQRVMGRVKLWRITALVRLAHFEEAERETKQVQGLIESLNDSELHINLQSILTELSFWGNRYAEGIEIGLAGLKLAQQVNEEKYVCQLMFYLGLCQSRVRKLPEAIATFQELNRVSMRTGDRSNQAGALTGIGFFTHFCGDWRNARRTLAKAIEIAQSCNDRYIECLAMVFWSWATEYECQLKKVEQLFQEGTKLARACGWRNLEGYFYFTAGRTYGSAFEPQTAKAEELLLQGQLIMQETQDLVGQIQITHALAATEGRSRPTFDTLAKLRSISNILTKKGETLNNCRNMCEMGDVAQKLGEWEESLSCFQSALKLAESTPFVDGQWRAHYGLARYYLHNKDEANALNHLTMAIAVINKLQQEFDTAEESEVFMADKQQIYITFAELCS